MRKWTIALADGCLTAAAVILIVCFLMMGLAIYSVTHKDQTQQERWEDMCSGPARYDAMREAAEKGKPNPC